MKTIFYFYLLLITCYLYADVPGNKPRPSYDVRITGLNQYNNHVFFLKENNYVSELGDSSIFHVQGGYGAPRCAEVWAINKKNLIHTDTLYFCSGDSKKSKEIIVNIYNRHLTYTESAVKQKSKNTIPLSSVNNFQDNDEYFNKNRNIMYVISVLSFIVLITLMFFVSKKNKQAKLQQSI